MKDSNKKFCGDIKNSQIDDEIHQLFYKICWDNTKDVESFEMANYRYIIRKRVVDFNFFPGVTSAEPLSGLGPVE